MSKSFALYLRETATTLVEEIERERDNDRESGALLGLLCAVRRFQAEVDLYTIRHDDEEKRCFIEERRAPMSEVRPMTVAPADPSSSKSTLPPPEKPFPATTVASPFVRAHYDSLMGRSK